MLGAMICISSQFKFQRIVLDVLSQNCKLAVGNVPTTPQAICWPCSDIEDSALGSTRCVVGQNFYLKDSLIGTKEGPIMTKGKWNYTEKQCEGRDND